ncbi:MBL fold metallo-hydrolase [Clostridium senegalense]|uniref:MBL fold metallo-hydrolase RNA specificity domain-containing protein n=1 Tax=Clostridium senegalense TaxID=1465809 RepID=UPI001C1255DA|nr:MBL fold metallo-hydrolase [Clostridium senegalense]MBU5225416.1 MBL fold metallo-hydrolase [Clostridium senegalense]
MKIKFCGAAKCITGSCHLLEVGNTKILLDCGLFQGKDLKKFNNDEFMFNPKEISAVILSHAHLDHSGRILKLYEQGFKGNVICTKPTVELCKVLLSDIENSLDKNEKNRSEIYFEKFIGYDYDENIIINEDISLVFRDAGHILGSAICEIVINDENNTKIVYSGDVGNDNLLIVDDPKKIYSSDYLILEGTYGDKIHNVKRDEFDFLVEIIKKTVSKNGNVVIPAFSLGRTQEIIYTLNKFMESEEDYNVDIYVDSPMSTKITKIFENNKKYFDKEAKKFLNEGDNPFQFKNLHFIEELEESKKLKNRKGIVIISSSGDCEGGRIVHHIKNNIEDKNSSLVFVCAQGYDTIGGHILGGKRNICILKEELEINCNIYNLQGLSGHADKNSLEKWVCNFKSKPKKIFLVHGSEKALCELKDNLEKKKFSISIPAIGCIENTNS